MVKIGDRIEYKDIKGVVVDIDLSTQNNLHAVVKSENHETVGILMEALMESLNQS